PPTSTLFPTRRSSDLGVVTRSHFLPKQEQVMPEHKPNRADDQHQIDATHPPIDLRPDAPAGFRRGNINVHFALGEVFGGAGVALDRKSTRLNSSHLVI